ncbi:esterase-like activity of phytase family protein [Algicella marina]|uniref:esterase-like activity of phytase family protein n=1 Tax=Algicella marina TaxID=2683284 RepID=UPI0024DFE009|nr:esterase-like activity of phytase family protein [Algicella marina]
MITRILSTTALAALASAPAFAQSNFNRIASFDVSRNILEGDRAVETSAEIIAATEDGTILVYTDSPLGVIGMIDIEDPSNPQPLGTIALEGEPTSVAMLRARAFVGINTSESYTEPSGKLAIFNVRTKEAGKTCDLSGQPDSVAMATDGSFVVVAIENERDEDLNDGEIPQMPAGTVDIFSITDGTLDCDSRISADLTGLAEIAPSDPEPEFVSINDEGEIVVTLQENNHIAILNSDGAVLSHFSAGAVDLQGVDIFELGSFHFTGQQEGRLREPDSVKWLDNDHFAIANEGDYNGGSRGWTVFNQDGTVVYESGTSFEYAIVEIGHYPEGRSANKGVEPESIESATFGETPMVFVGAERASVIGVYDATDATAPVLRQLLPSGIGPEGILALPERGLLISANETDLVEDGGARAHVMIYELQDAAAAFPTITSAGADELIGWGALSGLAASPTEPGRLYAVNDSFFAMQPSIFEIDATQTPARIVRAIPVTRGPDAAQKLDIEGIHANENGSFWLASEGRTDRLIPHALYHVGPNGRILKEVPFPAELLASEKRFGAEGITRVGDTLWIAIQREWADDPENHVKLVAYNIETEEWGAVLYPKASPDTGWVGLSEITAKGDWVYILERDNQIGAAAVTKHLYRVPLSAMEPTPLGGDLPVVTKELAYDFMSDLKAPGGYVVDKLEGFAIDVDGNAYAVTDNDGVDDSSGETHFIRLNLQ